MTSRITLAGQELLIYKNLTVSGPGAALLSISGNHASRLFEIAGNAQGGLPSFGPPDPSVIPGNGGDANGGAIYATGPTDISNSQFLQNSALGGSGGFAFGNNAGGNGGSAGGGALALSSFTALSFVSAVANGLSAGNGGLGTPPGNPGALVGSDIFATATLLSHYSALTSTSTTPLGNAAACATTTIVTQGANLDADNSCQNFSLHGDAKLQIVTSADATFAFPLWGSPLIDAAADCNDAFGETLTHDVRRGLRPLDGNADGVAACDIGAVESDELFANGFD